MDLVQPLGALRIEPHPDSGHWKIVFPALALNRISASSLADVIFNRASIRAIAVPTAWRAGGTLKEWWIGVQLKERIL